MSKSSKKFVKLCASPVGALSLQRLPWPRAVELRSAENDTRITTNALISESHKTDDLDNIKG